ASGSPSRPRRAAPSRGGREALPSHAPRSGTSPPAAGGAKPSPGRPYNSARHRASLQGSRPAAGTGGRVPARSETKGTELRCRPRRRPDCARPRLKRAFIYLHLANNVSQPLGTWIFVFDSFVDFTIRNYTKYSGKVGIVGTEDNWDVLLASGAPTSKGICINM
ncbi:hypothetical protein DV515_00003877, partial [Chloebia gouldiae]